MQVRLLLRLQKALVEAPALAFDFCVPHVLVAAVGSERRVEEARLRRRVVLLLVPFPVRCSMRRLVVYFVQGIHCFLLLLHHCVARGKVVAGLLRALELQLIGI